MIRLQTGHFSVEAAVSDTLTLKSKLTKILLKRAFSFGGKVTVGIVAVEISFPSTSAHVAKVSPGSPDE